LHELIIKSNYTDPVAPIWINTTQHAMDNLKSAILANPCLMRFNHRPLVVLRADFSSKGFGSVLCQPGTNAASKKAMAAYQASQDFFFITKESSMVLPPVAFGGRRCRGNKIHLHSNLGKGFASNWAINKNCHYLFSTRLVWVTD
jgi:hypothetical protein